VPTKKTSIITTSGGAGSVVVSGVDNSNPVGVIFQQGATQPLNTINFNVGNVNAAMTMSTSNVISSLPILINSPSNAQPFDITPKTNGFEMAVGGSVRMVMTNAPTGGVEIMGSSTFTSNSSIVDDGIGNDTTTTALKVQFGNSSGNVGQVGLSGTSAYLGTFTAPTTTPGVLVNINNGCELQFADATPNVYGMKSTAGVLNIGSASVPAAISIASTGQVTIPDIISGSFVPIGGIVMWSGGVLPANWRICDGTAGTPDLRDRFIIGAGTFASGTSGGSTSITTLNLPSHNHSITDPGHSHNVVLTGMFNNGDNGSAIVYAGQSLTGTAGNRQSDPNAAQTNTTGIIVNNTGGGIAYYQPYYALAYIIRVA
jgi:hypothetical protein